MNSVIYKNENGREYEVIQLNFDSSAILRPLRPTFEQFPYMIAKGFDLNKTSWNSGIYDLTLEEAKKMI